MSKVRRWNHQEAVRTPVLVVGPGEVVTGRRGTGSQGFEPERFTDRAGTEREVTHVMLDDATIRRESKGPRQVHPNRARFGRQWRFQGAPLTPQQVIAGRVDMFWGERNARFGTKAERAIMAHPEMHYREVVQWLRALRPLTKTQRVSAQEAGFEQYDDATLAQMAEATESAREGARQRLKMAALFAAQPPKQWVAAPQGHVKHCGCAPCTRFQRTTLPAVRMLVAGLRGAAQ